MMQLVDDTSRDAGTLMDQRVSKITRNYLEQAAEGINRMMKPSSRRARAINWLGSAWKWIAGSPDAEDWNAILNSEKMIIENGDQQIRINARLFDASHKSIQQLNDVAARVNAIDGDLHAVTTTLHKAIILADQVAEVTRACQLAKTGVTNSNLLDHEEIEAILLEVNDLPYQNAVEAVEWSSKTYAVVGSCSSIGNITVCPEKDLTALEESSCIPRLLKGGHASCSYLRSNEEVVQMVKDGTLFLSNYNGSITTSERDYQLEGTYIVQFNNEVITVRDKNFTAYSANHPMALPPVLTNITVTGYRPSLGYVDDVNAQNIQLISDVSRGVTLSFVLEVSLTVVVFSILFIIWKLTSTKGPGKPKEDHLFREGHAHLHGEAVIAIELSFSSLNDQLNAGFQIPIFVIEDNQNDLQGYLHNQLE
ncbi:uncharacterized protein Dana_GF27488 [Drosophila ananassae]|uniref:Uncharacterized protein n=1 Tax=Drosophila ananassae TaxID=7217 RepID=A0A0N8P176_DROAN|nr:uncharacterized protein Dana_GF27488 [Drosophila ananassae]